MAREAVRAEAVPGYAREAGAALWRLADARQRTPRVLADMPADDVDRATGGNTVASILYHVALTEADWLYTEILEAELPAELVRLFPPEHRDQAGVLSVVVGETLNQHLARLAVVRRLLLERLRPMTE
ncbi:MAG: DinB family protein [Chloroflexota bacterium]|nr:DinB family protein [Chloroflexota bacterium]